MVKMFEGLMKKFGYRKLSVKEITTIMLVDIAKQEKADMFIDYVVKTGKQKFYMKKGKKNVLMEEI